MQKRSPTKLTNKSLPNPESVLKSKTVVPVKTFTMPSAVQSNLMRSVYPVGKKQKQQSKKAISKSFASKTEKKIEQQVQNQSLKQIQKPMFQQIENKIQEQSIQQVIQQIPKQFTLELVKQPIPEMKKVETVAWQQQISFSNPINQAELQKAKKCVQYDLEAGLNLTIKAQKKVIQLNSKNQQVVPVLINLKTEDLTQAEEKARVPIDLICVIDISRSMKGYKIDLVKKTLISLFKFMKDRDRISLVLFDNEAKVLVPFVSITLHNYQQLVKVINSISVGSGTNIASGLQTAYQLLKSRTNSNPITSVFLLTDGVDNRRRSVVELSLKNLEVDPLSFTISCFGFGDDHDQDLLLHISNLRDGNFYYIKHLNTVDEAFADAFGGLVSVVTNQVSIYVKNVSFKPFDGIQIKKTFGNRWVKQGVTSGYQIKLKQLMAGVEKGFMAELLIPALDIKVTDKERTIVVVEASLVTQDTTGNNKVQKNATLMIHLINQDQPLGEIQQDGEVLQNYFRVKGALSIEQARKNANSGNFQYGITILSKTKEQIITNTIVNQKKLAPVVMRLEDSIRVCAPQYYGTSGKKQLSAGIRTLLDQRSNVEDGSYTTMTQTRMVNLARTMKKEEEERTK